MTTLTKYHIRQQLMNKLYEAIREIKLVDGANRSCISCESFDEMKELCKIANQRPPARVIALGCDSYIDTHIPF